MKKFIIYLLLASNLANSLLFPLALSAQETPESSESALLIQEPPEPDPAPVPTPLPTPTPDPTPLPDWQSIDGTADTTILPVGEGKTYRFRDTQVTVTFTKITSPGFLTIKQVSLTPEKKAQIGALSDTAYDITSTMPNSTFLYNLTLPHPAPQKEVEVKYSQDGQNYQEVSSLVQSNILAINNLDHFTLFVVTATPGPDEYDSIQSAIDAASDNTNTEEDPADTVLIKPGVYAEDITIEEDNLTIQGEDRDSVVIAPSSTGFSISPPSADASVSGVAIRDLTISPSLDSATAISLYQAYDTRLSNLVIKNSSTGIDISSSDLTNIFDTIFQDNAMDVLLYQDSSRVNVDSSTFSGQLASGVFNDTPNAVVAGNNDWGTADSSFIADEIYDLADDSSLGEVRYDVTAPAIDNIGIFNNSLWGNSHNIYTDPSHVSSLTGLPVIGGIVSISARFSDNYTLTDIVSYLSGRGFFADNEYTPFPANNGTWAPVSPGQYSVYWDSRSGINWRSVSDGDYDFVFEARDYGNSRNNQNSSLITIPLSVDNTSPDISFSGLTPQENATVSGSITVAGNFSDANGLMNTYIGVEGVDWYCQEEFVCIINTTLLSDGPYKLALLGRDKAGNETRVFRNITIDNTPPVVSWVSPTLDATISGLTLLQVNYSDAGSNIAAVQFGYRPGNETGQFYEIASNTWDTSSLPLGAYTLQATVTDTSGNTAKATRNVNVAAIISSQTGSTPAMGQITVSWTTDRPTTGRVVYDTVSHPLIDLNHTPNYDYAFSSSTVDLNKSTSHTVTLSGLSDNTTYYWRTVSSGSPTIVGEENQNRTFSQPSAESSGSGSSSDISTPQPSPTILGRYTTYLPQIDFEESSPLAVPLVSPVLPSPSPSLSPEVKGAQTFNWWLVLIPILLFITITLPIFFYRAYSSNQPD